MPDNTVLTAEDLAEMLAGVPGAHEPDPGDPDLLASLFGEPAESHSAGSPPDAASPADPQATTAPEPMAATGGSASGEEAFSWDDALHLVPGYVDLCRRYPPLTERHHPQFGRVIALAYLEDMGRRVRRNFKIGQYQFFDAPELEGLEPDTDSMNCRIVIKLIRYEVGLRIRYWQNQGGADVPGRSGAVVATEAGLRIEKRRG